MNTTTTQKTQPKPKKRQRVHRDPIDAHLSRLVTRCSVVVRDLEVLLASQD